MLSIVACSEPSGDPLHRANVLLLVVDALRADHLGCYGYERATSPFLDSLAAQGVLFESVTSSASHTVPAVVSLWSGLYPARHANTWYPRTQSAGIPRRRHRPEIPERVTLLAERFRSLGWRTGAVVANPWLAERFGFGRGFERYLHVTKDVRERDHPRAPQLKQRASELLDGWGDDRFFLYVHFMDVHWPYEPPEPHRTAFLPDEGRLTYRNGPAPEASPEDVAYSRALYDAEVRALDAALRIWWGELVERGLAERTLLVLVADHGDEFHEHQGLGHGWTLYQEVVHVPWLLVHPSLEPRRIRMPVSLVDVGPTLLELVGAPLPNGLDGVALGRWARGAAEPESRSRILRAELGDRVALRSGSWKGVREAESGPARWYDLASDPSEQRPLATPPVGAESLARELEAVRFPRALAARPPAGAAGNEETGDEELGRQLEALGYVD